MYNASKYIGNCLDSLINQDIPKEDYEIIVMDDGSTDDSIEIVSSYILGHSNILLYKEKNSGAYSTRNKLLKLAKGDYIYNIDADDYVIPNAFQYILKSAINQNVELICFDTKETFSLKDCCEPFNIADTISIVSNGVDFIKDNRHLRHEVWWYFIKRRYLEDLGLVFTNNEYNADVLFTLELLFKSNKVLYLKHNIHRYVQTNDSIMRSNELKSRITRIENMFKMILDKSKFINKVVTSNVADKERVLDNLRFRRDAFTFFTIIKMIQNRFEIKIIKNKIKQLKSLEAYPINHFIGPEYNAFSHKFLIFLINKKIILFTIINIRNSVFNIFNRFSIKNN
jgi:glycosyltransferase involved in cell wall biosynthesis